MGESDDWDDDAMYLLRSSAIGLNEAVEMLRDNPKSSVWIAIAGGHIISAVRGFERLTGEQVARP